MLWQILTPIIVAFVTALGVLAGQWLIGRSKRREFELGVGAQKTAAEIAGRKDSGQLAVEIAEKAAERNALSRKPTRRTRKPTRLRPAPAGSSPGSAGSTSGGRCTSAATAPSRRSSNGSTGHR